MQTTELFHDGQTQSVRLPEEFSFAGDAVYIKRVGDAVVLLPYPASWQVLVDSLSRFSDDFMEQREQPGAPEQENPFE